MESWLAIFVGLVAVAILIQTAVFVAIYAQIRRTNRRMEEITRDLETRVHPVLSRMQAVIEDVQPQLTRVASNVADMSQLARGQVQRADRIVDEAADRLRMQLLHADRLVTGALYALEEAGSTVRRSAMGPVRSLGALIRGVQAGLDFYRGVRRRPEVRETQDESLFI